MILVDDEQPSAGLINEDQSFLLCFSFSVKKKHADL